MLSDWPNGCQEGYQFWVVKFLELCGVEPRKGRIWGEETQHWGIMPPSRVVIFSSGTDLFYLEITCNCRRSPATTWRLETLSAKCRNECMKRHLGIGTIFQLFLYLTQSLNTDMYRASVSISGGGELAGPKAIARVTCEPPLFSAPRSIREKCI